MLTRTNWALVAVFASVGVSFFTPLGVLASLVTVAVVAFVVFVPLRSLFPEAIRFSRATGTRPSAWLAGTIVFVAGVAVVHFVGDPVYHYDCPWRAYGNCKTTHNYATVVYFAGVVALTISASYYGRYRLFKEGETSAAADIHDGTVVVSGEVSVCDETVDAPFTGEETVCHRYAVQERHNARLFSDGGSWHTVDLGADSVPFYVEDETGRVLVDPADADLTLNEVVELGPVGDENAEKDGDYVASGVYQVDAEFEVSAGDEPPSRVTEGTEHDDGVFPLLPRDRRYTEDHLSEGDDVVVAGEAKRVTEGYPEKTVIGANGTSAKVAAGDEDDVSAWITGAVWIGGALGVLLAPLGFALMLYTL